VERSAGRRRPVVQPTLRGEIGGWKNRRNHMNRRTDSRKECELGDGRRPLQCIFDEVLSLGIRRLGFYDLYAVGFGTLYGVTSCKADGEGTDRCQNQTSAKASACTGIRK
jgi:hypothetical protein